MTAPADPPPARLLAMDLFNLSNGRSVYPADFLPIARKLTEIGWTKTETSP